MKKILSGMLIVLSLLCSTVRISNAGEIDILLDVLVEQGVLTPVKAQIVKDETKKRVAEELAQQKSYAVPSWAQKIKLKGDLRLRHQYERKSKETQSRNRGRVRYRLGLEAKVLDHLLVGAGLASGSDDPRSTNQTFDDSFDTPDIRLDYAFAEYEPLSGVKVIAGKFKRKPYLWQATDAFWDGDINPEGGSVSITKNLMENTDGFLNTGVWVLEEINSGNTAIAQTNGENNSDPFLNYVQAGTKWKGGDLDATLAGIYYGFHGVQGIDFPFSRDTNTKEGTTFLVHDYDAFGFSGEFGVKEPFGLPIKRLAVFGDYINNVDPSDENIGWAAGIKFGDKKVKKKGQWQGKYQYAHVEMDAFPDIFPDSDRLGGDTNAKGHEAIFNYGLNKNVILGLDYYYSDRIQNSSDSTKEQVVQSDVVVKF